MQNGGYTLTKKDYDEEGETKPSETKHHVETKKGDDNINSFYERIKYDHDIKDLETLKEKVHREAYVQAFLSNLYSDTVEKEENIQIVEKFKKEEKELIEEKARMEERAWMEEKAWNEDKRREEEKKEWFEPSPIMNLEVSSNEDIPDTGPIPIDNDEHWIKHIEVKKF